MIAEDPLDSLETGMTHHTLTPTAETVAQVFSRETPAVLRINSGDSITVRTLDAYGYLSRPASPTDLPPQMFTPRLGTCMAGPIAVAEAEPGQMVAVHLEQLVPGTWGWTSALTGSNPLTRRLGFSSETPGVRLLWDIDAPAGLAQSDDGFMRAIAPFLGVIGVAPAEPGEHTTRPPRSASGGNIDCRELTQGSSLYLPVVVPEAMLFFGDGHAAQGDGEVGGTALECGMTTRMRVEVVSDRPLATIHAVTPAGWVTFGFHADLNEAVAQALDSMLTWISHEFEIDRGTALALASTAVDMRITQIANVTWGAHAVLPLGALARAASATTRPATSRDAPFT